MDEKIRLLRSTNLFRQLSDNELSIIAKYSNFKTYKDNEIIFREGTFGESMFIVKDAEVRIIKTTEDGRERDIAKFIKGDLFGDLDLFENAPRTAMARAEEVIDPLTREKRDTTLLVFPKRGIKFPKLLGKHPDMFARVLHILISQIASRTRSTNRLVSEKTQWIEDLRKQVLFDKLTGLYNRAFLTEEFARQLPGYGKVTSVLAAKPDQFKYINDTHGHDIGDKVLRLMADTIKSKLRENDFGVRYKSDEFIIILPGTENVDAVQIAQGMKGSLDGISISHLAKGDKFTTTWTFGIATYPQHEDDPVGITELCFKKMVEQRNAGGNGVLSA
jgi:diguanylate cyclase (GGDEF)-like protein